MAWEGLKVCVCVICIYIKYIIYISLFPLNSPKILVFVFPFDRWSTFIPFKMKRKTLLSNIKYMKKKCASKVKLHKGKQFFWKWFKHVKGFHLSSKSFLKTLEKISEPEAFWVSFNLKNEGQKKYSMTLQHFLHHTFKKMDTHGLLCWNPSKGGIHMLFYSFIDFSPETLNPKYFFPHKVLV